MPHAVSLHHPCHCLSLFKYLEKIRKKYVVTSDDTVVTINVPRYITPKLYSLEGEFFTYSLRMILIFNKIEHSPKKAFDAYCRLFFGEISMSPKKRKEEERKEVRRKEGRKNGWTARKRKRAASEWRLRIVGKRARTGNRRSRYPMPLLRAVSVSGDTKTNVFMR